LRATEKIRLKGGNFKKGLREGKRADVRGRRKKNARISIKNQGKKRNCSTEKKETGCPLKKRVGGIYQLKKRGKNASLPQTAGFETLRDTL